MRHSLANLRNTVQLLGDSLPRFSPMFPTVGIQAGRHVDTLSAHLQACELDFEPGEVWGAGGNNAIQRDQDLGQQFSKR